MGPYDPIVGLACAPIVETIFLELVMSLLGFSPRIPLGTFSILHYVGYNFLHENNLWTQLGIIVCKT